MYRPNKQSEQNRREFLEFLGISSLGLATSAGVLGALSGCSLLNTGTQEGGTNKAGDGIPVLAPSSADELRFAHGFQFALLASWGDRLTDSGVQFGYNNDFLAFIPIENSVSEGLLCVNHESPHPGFIGGYWESDPKNKTKEQVDLELASVGVSIVHIKEESSTWKIVKNSKYNRRIDGTTSLPLVSALPIHGTRTGVGTMGNCAGGVTPWGTYLTCEENYDVYYGEVSFADGKRVVQARKSEALGWEKFYSRPPEHYGWVVEIDPMTGAGRKLTGLGRFAHESATVRPSKAGRVVVYSGDDANNEHLYKFISEKPDSLDTGTLYVASTEKGEWIALDVLKNPHLRAKFKNQTELLIRTREAAKMVGATPLDRPEDIEICPRTGAVYVTLTNNAEKQNWHGSILKIMEDGNDPLSLTFKSSTFLSGGEASGFSCPDNLAFDRRGNLWMTSDISGSKANKGVYAPFKNNGLFYIPMSGPHAGKVHLVATAPMDSELTGPTFSPDGATLFLSVQHPGETSKSLNDLTSHWPEGGSKIPKPSVVAVRLPYALTGIKS